MATEAFTRALEETADTDITRVTPSVIPNTVYITQDPQQRLIKFKANYYELFMPHIHYHFELFPNFGETGKWYMHGVYFGRAHLNLTPDAFYPPLPNFDNQTPCVRHQNSRQGDHIPEVLVSYWSETFGGDGKLAKNPSWKRLARRAGVKPGDRKAVLAYWETLDPQHAIAYMQPGGYPRALK